jgi:simple sugar transport system ATP-binding protein
VRLSSRRARAIRATASNENGASRAVETGAGRSGSSSTQHPLAALDHVSKRFGTLQAVDDFSCDVAAGEVHALIGGNGAGKTTAMKMLAGLERPDSGTTLLDGKPIVLGSRRDGIRAGIGFIQQEFSVVDHLTCAENLLLGHPDHGWVLDRRRAGKVLGEQAERFGVALEPDRRVGTLSMGERQQLEILIALSWGGRVVILDEPTSATGESGLGFLRSALQLLRQDEIAVIYISHKLPEVLELADRITVMRRGRKVWEGAAETADAGTLARAMLGETKLVGPSRTRHAPGDPVLRLESVSVRRPGEGRSLHDINLEVHRYEVLGIAGVIGNGQRELARLCAGLVEADEGTAKRPRTAGYVAEDRSRDSLALELPPTDNAIVHAHRRPPIVRRGLLRRRAIRDFTLRLLDRFAVDPTIVDRASHAAQLSGGNQQRLVLGRELEETHDLLVLHNPARGLDVAATAELFRQLDAFRQAGGAAILISPDVDELLAWADAIQVLLEGRLSERLPAERAAADRIAERMAGLS